MAYCLNNAEKIEITPYESPWEVACKIITAQFEDTDLFKNVYVRPFFCLDDLRKIGEHIVNYCNTEQKRSET